jgi:hypothetical protein
MDYIPDLGSDGSDNSEFCFWVGNCDWHRIRSLLFLSLSIGRQLALFQRSERCIYLSFSLPFSFLLFFFISASCSLSGLHGRSGQASLPSRPPFSYVRSYVSHSSSGEMRQLGSQDRFSTDQIRSDQSVNQSKGKNNSKQHLLISSRRFHIQVMIAE